MSGTASSSVEVGYGGYRAPFTAVQWQELEHQAMIYKYLVAGLPVPPDLVLPIRRSFDALPATFFHHPSSGHAVGYCSYYGKKFDPEPGRCRRTDGKKWRCSKDAHPDSKYCERHMHRGRNRSRKHVESQSSSQSVSTAVSQISSNTGSFPASGSGSYQNVPFYSVASSEGSSFGSNVTKMQVEPISYGMDNKEFRYVHGDDQSFSPEASGASGGGGMWRLMPSQVSSSSMLKQKGDSHLVGPSSTQQPAPAKQHEHPVHPFFSEWPTTKESWSSLDDDDDVSNKNFFSSTQLSISIPRASANFSSSGYSTQGQGEVAKLFHQYNSQR